MNDELLTMVEREVLGWDGVTSEPGRFNSTVYRLGRREIGHVHHDDGVADLTFPRKIHDELISGGRAKPHGAGLAGVVSHHIREPEDVPGVLELFRLNYERLKESAAGGGPH